MHQTMRPFLLIIVLAACVSAWGNGDWDHVRFVDRSKVTGNWLFRGGKIVDDDGQNPHVQYDTLRLVLREKALVAGYVDFPLDYYIVDVCFLYEDDEDTAIEQKFWTLNPDKGFFVWYPIDGLHYDNVQAACQTLGLNKGKGNLTNCLHEQPRNFSRSNVETLATTYPDWGMPIDSLEARLGEVHHLLEEVQYDKPLVLYGHCHCGCDRTGEFFGSYYMRYQNRTFTQAMALDYHVPGNYIKYQYQLMTQWYCEYLVQYGLYSHSVNDCGFCDTNVTRCYPPPSSRSVDYEDD